MKTIAFFNNKGGVGKTTLVYHLAWMYAELGFSVVAADLDPQANLSAVFLSEDRLEQLWPDGGHPDSILGAVSPILRGLGDIREPHVEQVSRTSDWSSAIWDCPVSRQSCLRRGRDAWAVTSRRFAPSRRSIARFSPPPRSRMQTWR